MEDDAVLLHHAPSGPSSLSFSSPSPLRQHDLMAYLERLQHFLATAPNRWPSPGNVPPSQHHHALNRFLLPSGEYVTCVLWEGRYFVTGTDIVRALVFRFEAFGRPVRNMKKFEEGVFSDLRNLKPGQDACLEEPKSPFLDLLFKFQCIRTQKKQKVFYWFSVPHDRLFIDALERDLKREKMGHESTTAVMAEPAASFSYDPKRPLFEQFNIKSTAASRAASSTISLPELTFYNNANANPARRPTYPVAESKPASSAAPQRSSGFFNMFSFLEGTPTYKQRRKKVKRAPGLTLNPCMDSESERLYGRRSLDASLAAPVIGRRSFEGRRSYEAPSPRQNLDGTPSYGQYGMPAPIRVPSIHMPPVAQPQPQQMYGALQLQQHDMLAERSMEVDVQVATASHEIPQFNHVLTTPDNQQRYDAVEYEYEEKVYPNGIPTPPASVPAKWEEQSTSQASYMSISPFAYNETPSTSVSGSSPAMSLSQIQTHMPADDHSHSTPFSFPPPSPLPHPLSAPSHKLTFDIPALPNESSETRPRSADSRHHGHARRPSTASAVPSATSLGFGFGGPSGSSHSHSAWRYQPYPIRRVTTDGSMSVSGQSSPCVSTRGGSPFATATPSKDYGGMEHTSAPVEYQPQQQGAEYVPQHQQSLEYASSVSSTSESYVQTASANSSPEVQFVHMLRLQSGSPNMPEELTYPAQAAEQSTQAYDQQQYAQQTYDASAAQQQQGSPDSGYVQPSQSAYSPYDTTQGYPQHAHTHADAQSYHLVPQHQAHAHYYEQPVA